MKIKLFLQSISDVITNSSSEIFCTISSEQSIDLIYNLLDKVFGYNVDPELGPRVNLEDKESSWLDEDELKDYPDRWVEVELPYSFYEMDAFFKAGIEAILNERFGKGSYKIDWK